jgi:spermidine synthase
MGGAAENRKLAAWPDRIAPYLLFVFSGFAALVLEAVFLRLLTLLFGSTAVASALVLSAFMAGLAIGAALFGRVADRIGRPLRLFGILEIGTGLSGAALTWLLGSGRQLFLAPIRGLEPGPGRGIVEFTLAFLLVLAPTVLMGGTLPALGRAVIRRMDRFVASLGLLYGLNTFGAAAGVFTAGFFLLELVGISRTAYLAAAIQVAVGIAAILLDRVSRSAPAAAHTPADTERPSDLSLRAREACLVAAGVGGLAVLGYEVLWTRLLSVMTRSFSYSFSLMLSLFLLGLCIGAALLAAIGGRIRNPLVWVGWMQIGMGGWVAASLLWLPQHLVTVKAASFEGFLAASALRASAVVVPPTMLSGMVLPLAARGFARGRRTVGGDVGVVYGVNTFGAIVGALVAGLVLLPRLGAPLSLAILAVINAGAGAAIVVFSTGRSWKAIPATALAAASALSLAVGPERFVDAFLRASRGADRIGELLLFHEGAADTVAVVRKDYGFFDPEAKSLITNGVSMAATVKPVWRYMALEGHLPVLLSPSPRTALAVGVGTGITLGAVTSHAEIERIFAVELSEGVKRGLDQFREENDASHEDPRVRLIRGDGRHFLELTTERFDVITLEPPPPIVAGSVHLYSLDFYELCLRRLSDDGVVAQWLPLHAQSLASARMSARTFLDAFPEVMLWLPSVRDAVLVGSTRPLEASLERLDLAWADDRTRANLERAFLETPEAFLATYLLDRTGIEAWVGEAPTITDERPLMEFFRHQGGTMTDREIAPLLVPPQAPWTWVRGIDREPERLRAVEAGNEALRLYLRSKTTGDPAPGVEAARRGSGTEFFRYGFGCTQEQIAHLRAVSGLPPGRLAAHLRRCDDLDGRQGFEPETGVP